MRIQSGFETLREMRNGDDTGDNSDDSAIVIAVLRVVAAVRIRSLAWAKVGDTGLPHFFLKLFSVKNTRPFWGFNF